MSTAVALNEETTVVELRNKLESDPFNLHVVQVLSDIYLAEKNYLDFADIWEPVIKKYPHRAPQIVYQFERLLLQERTNKYYVLALIRLHQSEGSLTEVLEEVDGLLDLDPYLQETIAILLKISYEYKNIERLIPVLEKAVQINIHDQQLVEVLAGKYVEQKQLDKAIALYERFMAKYHDHASLLVTLADLYYQAKELDKSAAAYQRAMQHGQARFTLEKLEKLKLRGVDSVPFLYLLADGYTRQTKPDLALEKYSAILDVSSADALKIQQALKDFLKVYPEYPEALFVYSRALLLTNSYSEAVAELNRVIRLSPTFSDRVIEALQDVLKVMPEQAMAIQSLAELFLYKQDQAQALHYYGRLLEVMPDGANMIVDKVRGILRDNPHMIKAREIIARSYITHQQYRRAADEAEAILALDPNNAGAYGVLGQSLFALGEVDRAAGVFKSALSFDPYAKIVHVMYEQSATQKLDKRIMEIAKEVEKNQWKYSLRSELGKQYFHRGLLTEAISEFQVAVKDASLAADIHRMQGICFKELGRFDLAVHQFRKALQETPEADVAARLKLSFYMGLAYEAFGAHKEALSVYEEIMTQDMQYENIQIRMQKLQSFSWVELRGKALSAVIADQQKKRLIATWAKNNESEEFNKKHKNRNIDMSFSMDHNNKAVEHVLRGRYKAAEDELNIAEQMDPRFTISFNNFAVLYLINNNMSMAKEYLDKALAINPKVSIVHANLGVWHYMHGELKQAQNCYEKALALDNSLYTTHLNLGDLYYDIDDVQKALVYWNKVLDLGVVPELAKRRLKYRQP